MSAYLRKGRGWKYDFTLGGQRHTSKYYKTKGKEVGRLLSLVREAQLDGEISTKHEALELAKRLHRDEGQAGG